MEKAFSVMKYTNEDKLTFGVFTLKWSTNDWFKGEIRIRERRVCLIQLVDGQFVDLRGFHLFFLVRSLNALNTVPDHSIPSVVSLLALH